jgi:hypothetical protein
MTRLLDSTPRHPHRLPRRLVGGKVRFGPLPLSSSAKDHAAAVRRHLCLGNDAAIDVAALLGAQGWRILRTHLLDRAGHGREAALTPSAPFEFVVRVDPGWSARDCWEAPFHRADPCAIQNFRLAHELAHTFFYSMAPGDGDMPYRIVPPTADEETFCDDFATSLLVPPPTAARALGGGAPGVVDAALQLGAPLACVLRQNPLKAAAGRLVPVAPGELRLAGQPTTWGFPDWWSLADVFPSEWSRLVRAASTTSPTTFVLVTSTRAGGLGTSSFTLAA